MPQLCNTLEHNLEMLIWIISRANTNFLYSHFCLLHKLSHFLRNLSVCRIESYCIWFLGALLKRLVYKGSLNQLTFNFSSLVKFRVWFKFNLYFYIYGYGHFWMYEWFFGTRWFSLYWSWNWFVHFSRFHHQTIFSFPSLDFQANYNYLIFWQIIRLKLLDINVSDATGRTRLDILVARYESGSLQLTDYEVARLITGLKDFQ